MTRCSNSSVLANKPIVAHPLDDETYVCDFTSRLPTGVTVVSGTISQTDEHGEVASDLTIGSIAPNSTLLEIDGAEIAIGKALTFQMSGGTADSERRLTVVATCSDGFDRAVVLRVLIDDGLEN